MMPERSIAARNRRLPWSAVIVASELGRTLRIDGRRLGLLGSAATLQVSCGCGHAGHVSVADLVSRHGGNARVRDVAAALRCRHCGKRNIREVRWLSGECGGPIQALAGAPPGSPRCAPGLSTVQ